MTGAAATVRLVDGGLGHLADAELARRVSADPGLARAEEAELCARLGPRIRLLGMKRLGDRAAAADLAQRVLVLLLEKLRAGELRDAERVGSFVLGAARLLAAEARRSARRDGALPPELEEVAADGAEPPDPGLAELLARCLEALAERERTVILLSFYREQGAPEIAVALGVTRGNVRVIRHRAVARLRGCMGSGPEATP